jgi:hypothetical protein
MNHDVGVNDLFHVRILWHVSSKVETDVPGAAATATGNLRRDLQVSSLADRVCAGTLASLDDTHGTFVAVDVQELELT